MSFVLWTAAGVFVAGAVYSGWKAYWRMQHWTQDALALLLAPVMITILAFSLIHDFFSCRKANKWKQEYETLKAEHEAFKADNQKTDPSLFIFSLDK